MPNNPLEHSPEKASTPTNRADNNLCSEVYDGIMKHPAQALAGAGTLALLSLGALATKNEAFLSIFRAEGEEALQALDPIGKTAGEIRIGLAPGNPELPLPGNKPIRIGLPGEINIERTKELGPGADKVLADGGKNLATENLKAGGVNPPLGHARRSVQEARDTLRGLGINLDNSGALTEKLTPDQVERLAAWRNDTMNSSIEMGSRDLFYQKTLLANSLMPQLDQQGQIRYLFGKGIGAEISLQGNVIGRTKLAMEVPYRPHADFELYGMVGSYTPEFRDVFGAQEFFTPEKTKGLLNLPPGLLHDTSEEVDLGGVRIRVPRLELQFVDKMLKHNGTVERSLRGLTDHELLSQTYNLDRDLIHRIIDEHVIQPETSSWKPIEVQTEEVKKSIERQLIALNKRMQKGTEADGFAHGQDALEDFIFTRNVQNAGIKDPSKLFDADGKIVANLGDVLKEQLSNARAEKLATLQSRHAEADRILNAASSRS